MVYCNHAMKVTAFNKLGRKINVAWRGKIVKMEKIGKFCGINDISKADKFNFQYLFSGAYIINYFS